MDHNCVFPEYRDRCSRLASFNKWTLAYIISPNALADAGFFSTGLSDQVRCFQCGGGLKNWLSHDVPWEQHAFWFQNCAYVRYIKGSSYVANILNKFDRPEHNPDLVCKICFNNRINIRYVPCQHADACSTCSQALRICPFCRTPIEKCIKITL